MPPTVALRLLALYAAKRPLSTNCALRLGLWGECWRNASLERSRRCLKPNSPWWSAGPYGIGWAGPSGHDAIKGLAGHMTETFVGGDNSAMARRSAAAGWFIIFLAAGSATLPLIGPAQGALVIGAMLTLAGFAELLSATQRKQTRRLAMLAGVITIAAGILFTTDQATKFAPALIIVAGWLALRSATLAAACALEHGSVRFWTGLAAAVDFFLAVLLMVGLTAAALVISLFGATQPMIAQFAWVLAISFVATGLMLLEVASCARREDV